MLASHLQFIRAIAVAIFLAGKHQVRTKLRKNCGVKKQAKSFPRPGQLSGCQFDAKTSKSFNLSGYVVDNLCYDHYILKPGTAPDNVYLRTSLPQHTRAGVLFNFCAQSGHTTNMVLTTINWTPWKLELSRKAAELINVELRRKTVELISVELRREAEVNIADLKRRAMEVKARAGAVAVTAASTSGHPHASSPHALKPLTSSPPPPRPPPTVQRNWDQRHLVSPSMACCLRAMP